MTILRTLLLCFVGALPVYAAEEQLANDHLHLAFDTKTGGLTQLADQRFQFIAGGATNNYLWELRWKDSASGRSGRINSIAAKSFRIDRITPSSARLVWQNLGLPYATGLEVEARVSLDEEAPLSRWQIVLSNAGTLRFDEVRFPCVQNIARQENEFLAVPVWIGQLAANPRTLFNSNGEGKELRYDYPGHASMQCFAFYRKKGPGLYIACDDTNAFHKTFAFSGDGKDAAGFSLIQLPENSAGGSRDYAQSYNAILGTFTGDWFTAAAEYRGWATNQWWATDSRLQRDEKNWARETALWVWNRGRSEEVLDPALALQKKLELPVSAMWHWWHGCSYDVGFPEYLPPREGNSSFSNALKRAHQKDVHAIVYMNQRLWGMTTKSWDEKAVTNYAVVNVAGKIHPEVYNSFTKSPCASMCMGTPFWRNHYAGLTEQAFTLGVDGIYMDQACSSLACYNPAHGHPLGGGTYWMHGFRDMAVDIREKAKGVRPGKNSGNIALAGEGVGESWLPYLDLMLSLQISKERYAGPDGWEPIPFFQSVYHPYVIQYGNYSSLTMPPYDELWPKEFAPKEPLKLLDRKFSQQFYLEQARAFVWGQQPTIANFSVSHLKERSEEIDYVLQLAKLRNRALKFLQQGTFIGIPDFPLPSKTIDMSRLSIYAGQQGGLKSFTKEAPQVIASTWRADDGDVGVAIASISNDAVSVVMKLDRAYGLPKRGTIYRIDAQGRKKIKGFESDQSDVSITLPARGAFVLEFVGR